MSKYDPISIEQKWQSFWREKETYQVTEDQEKTKYYVLDMFPYPSGAGLHVGHPLGYIASDVIARHKRHQGYNVLHPMGYDSFGLPAEQYAIQTGQHPAKTTKDNITRYREQLDKIGFSFDWSREVQTSDPNYYKWTQWIFKQLYEAWYNNATDKAEAITNLITVFEKEGNSTVNASCAEIESFSDEEWNGWNESKKQEVLMHYRLAFLSDSWVNWCPALGTVLANDEIKDGVSERGGYPVEQKLMRQWSMRITAYAERLLKGLKKVDFSDALKEQQKNWIGKSKGASVFFSLRDRTEQIEVFTTRPDTIFGVSFMVLAPEHPLVNQITTQDHREAVANYQKETAGKTERDRQADVKHISGQFTGGYAIHPFTKATIPIWIGDYVLASYGTGAVMAVPAGDQRDYDFATHFNIPIPGIFEGIDLSKEAANDKALKITNSDFLNGLTGYEAISKCIDELEKQKLGKGKINYRLRDAIFSRQRYWGEPFPVYYKNDCPHLLADDKLPLTLPEVDKYLPTEEGEPPLARAEKSAWAHFEGDRMEYNTMPGWAGSSWYFLRYMDPNNEMAFVAKEKADYWNQVDLYIGGAEHATGHLLYSRFWTKFLYDMGFISFDEPFKKLINQGMILGRSSFIYRIVVDQKSTAAQHSSNTNFSDLSKDLFPPIFISKTKRNLLAHSKDENAQGSDFQKIRSEIDNLEEKLKDILLAKYPNYDGQVKLSHVVIPIHVDISLVDNDMLAIESFRNSRPEYKNAEFILEDDGNYICGHEVEKMSKSKFNVQTPDELVEKFGADTLRCYEMFLGPLEQAKPWDVKGINGVSNFLRKFWRLFHPNDTFAVSKENPNEKALKTLHKTIKKVSEELERYSFNTVVSTLMIAVNELTDQKCNTAIILSDLTILLSPYAPHLAEELWQKLGNNSSITDAPWPIWNEKYLIENEFEYPVSFNGKMRFKLSLPIDLDTSEIEKSVLEYEKTSHYLDGKPPKKIIVVPKRIINIVI